MKKRPTLKKGKKTPLIHKQKVILVYKRILRFPNRVFIAEDFRNTTGSRPHLEFLIGLGLIEKVVVRYNFGNRGGRKTVTGYKLLK